MARDLPVGNGNLLVNFDKNYNVRDIYYPNVGKANHSYRCISRTGILVDGQFSWLSDRKWVKDMDYAHDTLATHVTATNDVLDLKLTFNDAVDFNRNVFLRRVEVTNLSPRPRNVRLFFHYDFLLWGVGRGDSIHYYPDGHFLVAYKDDCYFLMDASAENTIGISSWSTGNKDAEGVGGSWSDAEDGILQENPNEFGSIDGIIAADLASVPPQGSSVCHTWLAAGKNLEEVRSLDAFVRRHGPQYLITRTMNYWRAWLDKEETDFRDLPQAVKQLYRRSLLIIRTQIDNGGGIVAANDSDLDFLVHGRESYSYVWPRDGAYVAHALDMAGYAHLANRFYNFCNDVIHIVPDELGADTHKDQAYMLHKYTPDKLVASSWMTRVDEQSAFRPPIQEDETALIPYVLWRHYLKFRDIESLTRWYRPLVVDIGNFLTSYRDIHTKLPAPSFDLWEEHVGIYAYTVATVWAGLSAAAKLASLFGEDTDANRFRDAASEIKQACETHLYDQQKGRFLKKVLVRSDGSLERDLTVDASLYALWYFGMFEPSDPRITRTMDTVVAKLSVHTEVGGLARYEGDEYHWDSALNDRRGAVPGNPWIISTLWLTQYHIARAQSLEELQQVLPEFEWVCGKALRSGVLPEQIHPLTGDHLSVSPLTWSQATLVATVQEYIARHQELQREPNNLSTDERN